MTKAEATTSTQAAAVAKQGAHVAPKKAASKKVASPKRGAPKGQQAGKQQAPPTTKKAAPTGAKPASKKVAKPKEAAEAREGSKKSIVLELLRRPKGATLAELAKATGWQNHSIRGFISGTLSKKMGLTVESTKNEANERAYCVDK